MHVSFGRREIFAFYLVILAVDLLLIIFNAFYGVGVYAAGGTGSEALFSFVQRQLDPSMEQNLATWYSSALLLLAALVALFNMKAAPLWQRWQLCQRLGWALLAALFLWLSADETATVHEYLAPLLNQTRAMQPDFSPQEQYATGAGDWLAVLLPFLIGSVILLVALSIIFFAKRLRLLVLPLAGVLCWVGVLFLEASEANPRNSWIGGLQMPAHRQRLLEESLEFLGTTLFLVAFIEFYRWRATDEEVKR